MDAGTTTVTYDVVLKKFAGDDQTVEPEEIIYQTLTYDEFGQLLDEHVRVEKPHGTDDRLA